MTRKASPPQANCHHTLVTDAWTADVQTLERGIGEFKPSNGAPNEYHVSLFELAGDPRLHVNVMHKQQTRPVAGWSGPGVVAAGFIHNRTFESSSTAVILRSIRAMVFAARN